MLGAPTGACAVSVCWIDSRKDAALHGRVEEVEVERGVHLVWTQVCREPFDVGHPDLTDEHARAGIRVGDRAPRAVDVVQFVTVFGGMLAGALLLADLGQVGVLDQQGRGVDAHTRDAAVEPELQDLLVLAAHIGVVPVEVGLLGSEHVQVPLPRRAVGVRGARPGRSLEAGHPVRRDLIAVLALAGVEPEALALRAAGSGGERRLEPLVLIADVVRHHIDDGADAEGQRLLDERLRFTQRSELRVDVAVVLHVVAAVGHRARVPGVEPDGVDAEILEVAEVGAHSGEVSRSVAAAVGEAAHVDLVDHGGAPPQRVGRRGRRAVPRGLLASEDVAVHGAPRRRGKSYR